MYVMVSPWLVIMSIFISSLLLSGQKGVKVRRRLNNNFKKNIRYYILNYTLKIHQSNFIRKAF